MIFCPILKFIHISINLINILLRKNNSFKLSSINSIEPLKLVHNHHIEPDKNCQQ